MTARKESKLIDRYRHPVLGVPVKIYSEAPRKIETDEEAEEAGNDYERYVWGLFDEEERLDRILKESREKLLAEGLRIAKERGLEFNVASTDRVDDGRIPVRREADKVNVANIIELAKDSMLELYKQYMGDNKRCEAIYRELNRLSHEACGDTTEVFPDDKCISY